MYAIDLGVVDKQGHRIVERSVMGTKSKLSHTGRETLIRYYVLNLSIYMVSYKFAHRKTLQKRICIELFKIRNISEIHGIVSIVDLH